MNQPIILKRNNTPTNVGKYIGAKSTVHRCEVVFAYESEGGFRFNDGDSEYGVEVYEFWSDRIDIEFEFEESEPVQDHIPDVTKKGPPCKECGGDYPCPCYGLQPEKPAVPEREVYGEIDGYGRDENGRNFVRVFIDIDDPKFSFQSPVCIVASEQEPQPIEIEPNQTWRFKKGGKKVKTVDCGNDLWLIADDRGKACKVGGCYLVPKEGLHNHLNEHAEFVPEEAE